MPKNILIVGVGSFGGFFAEFISHLPGLQKIMLIDPDKVEESNLINSIYRRRDIGRRKVFALQDIIKNINDDIIVNVLGEKFIEKAFNTRCYDLVFDCRDIHYSRYGTIDVRFYIAFNHLIIDCRKRVNYKSPKMGEYLDDISYDYIKKAAYRAYDYVRNGKIYELIKRGSEYNIDLNNNEVNTIFQLQVQKNEEIFDLAYDDVFNGEEKLTGHIEKLPVILKENKKFDIPIYLGSKDFALDCEIIPKQKLRNISDVIKILSEIANNVFRFNGYLVSIGTSNGRIFIELIPEDGGA